MNFSENKNWNEEEKLFRQICEEEGMQSEELNDFFDGLMEDTERRIEKAEKKSNHLTVLNRQLRAAAAVFLMVASCSLLMSVSKKFDYMGDKTTYRAPFELAAGSKLLP